MSWNYRIVKYADDSGYGVHEVYYNPDGSPRSMTQEPAVITGDTESEIREATSMMMADTRKRPVFEEPPGWRLHMPCKECGR